MKEPDYAGIKSFFGAPGADIDAISDGVDIAALGLPFDGGVTNQPGARYGPEGIREATARKRRELTANEPSYNFATGRVSSYDHLEIRDYGDVTVVPNDIEATFDRVRDAVRKFPAETFPVLLGGDHSLTYPAFEARGQALDRSIGLVQLDAHTDTWGTDELYGEYYHGSPMSHIAESEYGSYDNHAVVGLRGYTDERFLDIESEEGLYAATTFDVKNRGIESCLREAVEHASQNVDAVYLTVDIDVVDPAFAPGTGTPVPGGISSYQFLTAADILGEYDAISAIDLMEVAPRIESGRTTVNLGASFLARFLQERFAEA